MKKLLKGLLALFILALVVLLGLSYLEKEHGLDFPASGILAQIKDGWENLTKSADDFLTESGIKEDTAELLEKGAELLKSTPGPNETPDATPETGESGEAEEEPQSSPESNTD